MGWPCAYHAVAQTLGKGDIKGLKLGISFNMDLVELDGYSKRICCQKRELMGGIRTLYIECGTGLCIAQALGICHSISNTRSQSLHFQLNVVADSVDGADDPFNVVGLLTKSAKCYCKPSGNCRASKPSA